MRCRWQIKHGERVAAVKISAAQMPLRNFGHRNRIMPPYAWVIDVRFVGRGDHTPPPFTDRVRWSFRRGDPCGRPKWRFDTGAAGDRKGRPYGRDFMPAPKASQSSRRGRREKIKSFFRRRGVEKTCRWHVFSLRSRRLCRRSIHLVFEGTILTSAGRQSRRPLQPAIDSTVRRP